MPAEPFETTDYRGGGDGVPITGYRTMDGTVFVCQGCADAHQAVLEAKAADLLHEDTHTQIPDVLNRA